MKIGKLIKESVKSVWAHEANDFTPWLAKQDNLNLLGEEIGVDLTLIKPEASIGDFKVDLYCEETNTENIVIIENQYEASDHKHLGQLITYAAGLNAKIIIWVLESVREEHRAGIDWLNDHMVDIDFFIIQLEVWKIGDSDPAAKFTIIAKPNTWSREVHRSEKMIELSPLQALRIDFWTKFKNDYRDKFPSWGIRKPSTRYYYDVIIGGEIKYIGVSFDKNKKRKSVYLWLVEDIDEKPLYDFLFSHKAKIEEQFGLSLIWSDHKGNMRAKKSSSISYFTDGDIENSSEWPIYIQWFQDTILKFIEVFEPFFLEYNSESID